VADNAGIDVARTVEARPSSLISIAAIALTIAVACAPARQAPTDPAKVSEAYTRPPARTLTPRPGTRASRSSDALTSSRAAPRPGPWNECVASWYGDDHAGRTTASGELFDPDELTAAHLTLQFGTRVEVRARGRAVVVRITDRGPAEWTGRCLDLSEAAFARLAPLSRGVINVQWRQAA
jgi:rare lipoprotein A